MCGCRLTNFSGQEEICNNIKNLIRICNGSSLLGVNETLNLLDKW